MKFAYFKSTFYFKKKTVTYLFNISMLPSWVEGFYTLFHKQFILLKKPRSSRSFQEILNLFSLIDVLARNNKRG